MFNTDATALPNMTKAMLNINVKDNKKISKADLPALE